MERGECYLGKWDRVAGCGGTGDPASSDDSF